MNRFAQEPRLLQVLEWESNTLTKINKFVGKNNVRIKTGLTDLTSRCFPYDLATAALMFLLTLAGNVTERFLLTFHRIIKQYLPMFFKWKKYLVPLMAVLAVVEHKRANIFNLSNNYNFVTILIFYETSNLSCARRP